MYSEPYQTSNMERFGLFKNLLDVPKERLPVRQSPVKRVSLLPATFDMLLSFTYTSHRVFLLAAILQRCHSKLHHHDINRNSPGFL